jgi:hypothetical protein
MRIKLIFSGGLGNQLFQLAFALEKSTRNSAAINYSLIMYENYKIRAFALNDLCKNLDIEQSTDFKLGLKLYIQSIRVLQKLFKLMGRAHWFDKIIGRFIFQFGLIVNFDYYFHQYLLHESGQRKKSINILGYYQSAKYFSDSVGKLIMKSIFLDHDNIDNNFHDENILWCSLRLGRDYQKSGNLFVRDVAGYIEDLRKILKDNPEINSLRIVTDDVESALISFSGEKLGVPTAVIQSNATSQLHYMRCAKYLYISNSSFSWWGAYFNKLTVNGKVYAPKTWFNFAQLPTDIHLDNWILLD